MVSVDNALLMKVVGIAESISEQLLALHNNEFSVRNKQDHSPLTVADMLAHRFIARELNAITPDLPILSEESFTPSYQERSQWSQYWLIDPLDGTSSFIRGGEEFTVNIALVESGEAVLGVVSVPCQQRSYAARKKGGAFCIKDGEWQLIQTSTIGPDDRRLRVLDSWRDGGKPYWQLVDQLSNVGFQLEHQKVSSSKKLCMLAEGEAELIACYVPTSEWDSAAGQVIVEQAGGMVVHAETFKPLRYNTKSSVLNPSFLVFSDAETDWQSLVKAPKAGV